MSRKKKRKVWCPKCVAESQAFEAEQRLSHGTPERNPGGHAQPAGLYRGWQAAMGIDWMALGLAVRAMWRSADSASSSGKNG